MRLIDHTTYDEVRSLLGVRPLELKDEVLALPHWLVSTEFELRDVDQGSGDCLTSFTAVQTVTENTRTVGQKYFFQVFNAFVLYSIARQLLGSYEGFSPAKITDGRAAVERNDRLARLLPAIEGGYQSLAARLKEALQALNPAATVAAASDRIMITSTGLGTDPVTGV